MIQSDPEGYVFFLTIGSVTKIDRGVHMRVGAWWTCARDAWVWTRAIVGFAFRKDCEKARHMCRSSEERVLD